jgi:hypothetical protein
MPATPTCAISTCMKLKLSLAAFAATALAAVPMALAAMPSAEQWEIGPWVRGKNFSVGMPAHPSPGPSGSLVMEFPVAGSGEVDALTTSVGPLAGARQITLRYRVDAARGTRFIAHETPGEPATVSLYFQQAGDNWSGRGRFAFYRWYSPARAVVPLEPGQRTITVRLDEAWTNVNGQPAHAVPAGYAAALRDTARIGLAFGSSSRRSHGVHTTGPARFTLLSLDIN